MEKFIAWFKIVMTTIVSLVVSYLGGYDKILSLLIALVCVDIVTGFTLAIVNKKVSSHVMKSGLIKKLFIFVAIFIAFKVDECIVEYTGSYIELFGMHIRVRTLFVAYCCIEEGISLIENLGNLGVPMPKWLRGVLIQISDCANKSTPQEVLNILKKYVIKSLHIKTVDEDSSKGVSLPAETQNEPAPDEEIVNKKLE